MVEIKYKEGDALLGYEQYFAHGCNAQGVMGSGIAKQVKEQYPEAFSLYRKVYEGQANKLYLGQVIASISNDVQEKKKSKIVIYNCVTQDKYGRDPTTRYVDYAAIETCMQFINEEFKSYYNLTRSLTSVAMPMIGAGLGNGDWDIISKIIENTSIYFQPVIYKYNDKGQ